MFMKINFQSVFHISTVYMSISLFFTFTFTIEVTVNNYVLFNTIRSF